MDHVVLKTINPSTSGQLTLLLKILRSEIRSQWSCVFHEVADPILEINLGLAFHGSFTQS